MNMIRKITISLAVAVLLLSALISERTMAENLSSRWIIDEHTKSRLFVGGYDKEKGILHLGWQVSLKDGWKTYWRSPGEAGLPPRWEWSETKNIRTISVNWPRPELHHIFGMDTYTYHNEVILPIDLEIADKTKAVSIALNLQYLICADICIPQEGDYSLDVSKLGNIEISPFQKAQLERYRDLVPTKLPGTNIVVQPDPEQENMLMINLTEDITSVENIIVEDPDGFLLGQAASKGKSQYNISYNAKQSLEGRELTLTLLLNDGRAREMKVTVHP